MANPVYSCKACGKSISSYDETCPHCGANLSVVGRLIEVRLHDIAVAGDTVSTAVYAPPDAKPTEEQLGRLDRIARAVVNEAGEWRLDGVSVVIPPFVLRFTRVKRKG